MPRTPSAILAAIESVAARRRDAVDYRDLRESDMRAAMRDVETAERKIHDRDLELDDLFDELGLSGPAAVRQGDR